MPSGGPLDPKQSSTVSNEIHRTPLYTNTKDFGLVRDRVSNAFQALHIHIINIGFRNSANSNSPYT
jgi:hypothetical protein